MSCFLGLLVFMTEIDINPTTDPTPDRTTDPIAAQDPRELLARALDQTGELIAGTDPSLAQAPTPCADFDVAALIGHLQGVVRRIGIIVRQRPLEPMALDWPIEMRAAHWASGRADTDIALAQADLEARVQVPWGEVTVAQAIGSYVSELAVHGWDLAVATGRMAELDPQLAEAALPWAMAKIPAEPRGGFIPFGPVVPVPEDGPAYQRLLGWTGRDPHWHHGN